MKPILYCSTQLRLMKIIAILFVLVGCKNQTKNIKEQIKPNRLNYKIYQYKGNDSLNGHISKLAVFNNNDLIKYEKYTDYIEDGFFRTGDKEITYYYRDTLLIKVLTKHINYLRKDSSRIEYLYNNKGLLIKKTFSEHYRPFKEGKPDGCLVDSSDFKNKYIWKITETHLFKFDNNNREIEKYIPEHAKVQNRFQSEYDYKGRIIKETSFSENELVQEKFYEYVENGYNLTSKDNFTGYEEFRFIKDLKENIIQERKEWKETQMYRIEKKYDTENRLILEKRYDRKDKLELTYKYIYQNYTRNLTE